ncbi:MAG TPA: DUF2336 domain-containing protein [Allosphingosinicella sp.]
MSDTRPSGGEVDGAAELLASARARLRAAAADLAIPQPLRLSEWQRTIVARLREGLVRGIEDALRAALADRFTDTGLRAALGSAHLPLALPILEAAGSLSDPFLVGALLRRAEESRLAGGADHRLLAELAGDDDAEVAAEAMSLLILQGSRADGFGEPVMGRAELPAELQHRLTWTIAAALRRYLVERHDVAPAAADQAVAAAVAHVLAGYDEGDGTEARSLRLARRLAQTGRLDDAQLAVLLPEAGLPLLLGALAARGGVAPSEAWALIAEPGGRGAILLLRAAGLGREAAAAILLQLGAGEAALPARLDAFETIDPSEADGLLQPWRADPAYRSAILELRA